MILPCVLVFWNTVFWNTVFVMHYLLKWYAIVFIVYLAIKIVFFVTNNLFLKKRMIVVSFLWDGWCSEFENKPKSVISPTFQSILSISSLFMTYQHFFMIHDVTWTRRSKRAISALALLNVRQCCAQSARNKYQSDINSKDRFGVEEVLDRH